MQHLSTCFVPRVTHCAHTPTTTAAAAPAACPALWRQVTETHFKDLKQRYGDLIVALNLLKSSERRCVCGGGGGPGHGRQLPGVMWDPSLMVVPRLQAWTASRC
jgi:hypothetical protein